MYTFHSYYLRKYAPKQDLSQPLAYIPEVFVRENLTIAGKYISLYGN